MLLWYVLGGCTTVQLGLLAWLTMLSRQFAYGSVQADRPIPLVVGLFTVMFGISLVAAIVASRLRCEQNHQLILFIVGTGLAFRGLFFFSEPIQEVDIYRYLWDGAVTFQGESPYRYAPSQGNPKLLTSNNAGLVEVHRRVHYAEIQTVYPPVSQIVFAAAYGSTPSGSSVKTYVRVMKAFILLFDAGILLVGIAILLHLKLNLGWSLLYAWSPLVLKEFANSGHLDSIAVFWMILAVFATLRLLDASTLHRPFQTPWLVSSGISLGLGIGAKLFPVVIVPVLAISILARKGMTHAAVWFGVVTITSMLCLLPMMRRPESNTSQTKDTGLATFLKYWEMNDLIFMVAHENLRPQSLGPVTKKLSTQPTEHELWFVIVPNTWRQWWTDSVASKDLPPERVPFVTTRYLTIGIYGLLTCLFCGESTGTLMLLLSMRFTASLGFGSYHRPRILGTGPGH